MPQCESESVVKDILSVKMAYNMCKEKFAGYMCGMAVFAMRDFGMNKGQVIAAVSNCYDKEVQREARERTANDT